MIAITYQRYGSPEVLRLERIERPHPSELGEGEVLVRVMAAGVNPLDWHFMRGTPYFLRLMTGVRRPKETRLGRDFAGVIEEVGPHVDGLRAGDEVYGAARGSFAEYAIAHHDKIAAKPANLGFEEAAAAPIAGLTALQALRDAGKVQAGETVLVNGASGGVGSFAVQIAKASGARVTAVCGGWNAELVRSLGADQVIDYSKEDFAKRGDDGRRFDLLVDCVGNRKLGDCRRVLARRGRYVAVAGPEGRIAGPLFRMIQMFVVAPFISQRLPSLLASLNRPDLEALTALIEEGKVTPAVERRYDLDQVPAAIRYLETGHARGKTVIRIGDET
ncbi:MAG TPA: NAD(P)-dependent alcohol dehydrogenase [Thermoanaerobaculia bacterium]|nr:NAD(P)-dependent alcohol dehydrogenase [Thermoanaerobaculia bacterium]